MTVNEKIMEALKPFRLPVHPDYYRGDEKRYFTFNYEDDRAADFGDDQPLETVAYMQIHLFLNIDENYLEMKKEVRKALFKQGFTYPEVSVDTEPDKKIRHIIFECDIENKDELSEM